MDKDFERLVAEARKIVGKTKLSEYAKKGTCSTALMTSKGEIYTGVNIDANCGIGCCSEYAAIAEMLKHNETRIDKIVAISKTNIYPPCGRCRELIRMIDINNVATKILVSEDTVKTLAELLPDMWIAEDCPV